MLDCSPMYASTCHASGSAQMPLRRSPLGGPRVARATADRQQPRDDRERQQRAVHRSAPCHPSSPDGTSMCEIGTTIPEATAPMPASSAVNAAVTTVMRSPKSRLITAGISTFAIAMDEPMSAVPSQRFAAGPGIDRQTVPAPMSSERPQHHPRHPEPRAQPVRERRDDGERDERNGGEGAEGGLARAEVVGDLSEERPDARDRRAEVRRDQQHRDEQQQPGAPLVGDPFGRARARQSEPPGRRTPTPPAGQEAPTRPVTVSAPAPRALRRRCGRSSGCPGRRGFLRCPARGRSRTGSCRRRARAGRGVWRRGR